MITPERRKEIEANPEKFINAQTKGIIDVVAVALKGERKRTEALIAKALPADHQLIPKLVIATIKLQKSDIREYCNNLLHRNSRMVEVRNLETPYYLKVLDNG